MTLYKKAVFVLVTLLAAILSATLFSVFDESREYIENELFTKAQNSASSLGVAMSQVDGDVVRMSIMADAVFDTGIYEKIELKSMKGESLFVKRLQDRDGSVPDWFVGMFDISAPKGVAQVSDGWRPIGILEVEPNLSLAYGYLYSLFNQILVIFFLSLLVGTALVIWILRLLLKPLETVKNQAEEVLKNRFVINERLPDTKELAVVTDAVNALVKKMRGMYDRLAEITERNRRLEYLDKTTSLYNRDYFLMKYDLCGDFDAESGGHVAVFRICGIEQANRRIGYDRVNTLVKMLARSLQDSFSEIEDALVCRLSGREMAVLLPDVDRKRVYELSSDFIEKSEEIVSDYPEIVQSFSTVAAVAPCEWDLSRLLSALDLALGNAENSDRSVVDATEFDTANRPVRKDEWRVFLEKALSNGLFKMSIEEVVIDSTDSLCLDVSFALVGEEGAEIEKRIYMPLVFNLGMFERFARYRFEKILNEKRLEGCRVVLEFPYRYVETVYGIELISEYNEALKKKGIKLVVQLMQHEIAKSDRSRVERVFERLSRLSIDTAIDGFDADGEILKLLKSARPLFVRVKKSRFKKSALALQDSTNLLLESIGCYMVLDD